MCKNIKVRNMRNEYKYSLVWNFVIVFMVSMAALLVLPESGPIGKRSMLVLYLLDGTIMFSFMFLLEKYTVTISGVYEKGVITILSSLYTFVII